MSEAERKLLVWCAIMLVRGAPLTPDEADEIDQLIADVRSPLPKIVWDTPVSGRVVEVSEMYASYTYKWPKGSSYPMVTIYNAGNIAVAWIKGVRARTLLTRLRAGIPLGAAMALLD